MLDILTLLAYVGGFCLIAIFTTGLVEFLYDVIWNRIYNAPIKKGKTWAEHLKKRLK